MDALHWVELAAIAVLTVCLGVLCRSQGELERRVTTTETAPSAPELRAALEDVRRAHVRLDNQQRQLEALSKELGWTDDRMKTKLLGSPP